MTYMAAEERYDSMLYRRCGRSGLDLPAISRGLWHNFGDDRPIDTSRAMRCPGAARAQATRGLALSV